MGELVWTHDLLFEDEHVNDTHMFTSRP